MSSRIKQEFLHSVEFSGVQEAACIHLILGLGIWDVPALLEVGSGSQQSSRISRPPRLTQGWEQPCPVGIVVSLVLEMEPMNSIHPTRIRRWEGAGVEAARQALPWDWEFVG